MGADNSDELGILYGMPERWPLLHRFPKMDQRDQELLDKQLRRLNPPRSEAL
jgi:hypothetical protein